MAASADNPLQTSAAWLQRGQSLETEGLLDEAIAAYDNAIAIVRLTGTRNDLPACHALGLAWMNRGNALQKIRRAEPGSGGSGSRPDSLRDALAAYDEAIALFRTLPVETEPVLCNHLGAAWLNRGHAHISAGDFEQAAVSFGTAIAELAQLPIATDPYFRLNLAGAHTNLAHATIESAPARAAAAARSALAVLADVERAHEAFAGLSLRARRALVMALGAQLHRGTGAPPVDSNPHEQNTPSPSTAELVSEATDAIDDGLAIARDLETHGMSQHRPLACRLFRLGVQLYGTHQPQFLGEFVLETLATPAFGGHDEFRAIADDAIADALAQVQRPHYFMAGTPDSEKLMAVARSVRAAQQQLALATPAHD